MTAPVLGFVGLGNMGKPMSTRLTAAGYTVIAFDAAGTAERLPEGARAAATVADLAMQADVVLLSLPDGAASKAVCGQLAAARPRRVDVVVDLSTIGIAAARECAALLATAGMTYVDAPVSGGIAGARGGTLAMMVGTEQDVFERLRPILAAMAKNVFRMGDAPGQGQAMKLLNNFLSATVLSATSEAVLFGAKTGLDLTQMIEVINVSSGRTTASSDKFPRSILSGTYDFGFSGAMMAKDVTLYMESVETAASPHDIGATVARVWQRFNEACPGRDFTYIYQHLADRARE